MANEKQLVELIEQVGDKAIYRHIALTAEMMAQALKENGVEIPVRCKDCKYAKFIARCSKYMCGKYEGSLMFSNDFCSYGERRADNG